jgi:hypothetical protein
MFHRCEPPRCLIQSLHCNQVLTGVVPYDDSNRANVINDIKLGKRPSRPTDPGQNQWLQDPVWDTITTCWSDEPGRRHKLPVVHRVFSEYDRRDLSIQVGRNPTIQVLDIEPGLQQRGRVLPRIASLFQSLWVSQPEIERLVSEIDKVASACTFPLKADMGCSV